MQKKSYGISYEQVDLINNDFELTNSNIVKSKNVEEYLINTPLVKLTLNVLK